MSFEAEVVSLGDIAEEIRQRHGSALAEVPVFGVQKGIGLTPDTRYVSEDLSRYKRIRPGDFAYNPMRLNIGSIGLCKPSHQDGLVSPDYVAFRPNKSVLPEFLDYYTRTPQWSEWTERAGTGSVRSRIYFRQLAEMKILLPNKKHQRASVHLLQLLDEKIANNSALAADLEAIARAFFKSWFVDFDPVKAKMEGRLPVGMDADTAALFPDELIESELGLIPCGWEAATLANHAALNPESWSARNHPETVQYADLAGTDRGQIVETKTFVWEDAPSRARRVLRLGDTIIGTVRPGNRAYSFVGVDGLTGSTGFAVLRPNNSSQRSLVYLAATSDDAINRLVNLADGAAYPAVRPDVVAATPIVTPPDAVIEEFAKITQPLLDWVVAAHAENTELAQLRDILLPRLISGKLRLPGVFNDTEPTLSEEHTNV